MIRSLIILIISSVSLSVPAQVKTIKEGRVYGGTHEIVTSIQKSKNDLSANQASIIGQEIQAIDLSKINGLKLKRKGDYISGSLVNSNSLLNEDQKIQSYLQSASGLMKIDINNTNFVKISSTKDERAEEHIRMQQQINGIPVYGAEIIVHKTAEKITGLNGKWIEVNAKHNVDTEPKFSKAKTQDKIRSINPLHKNLDEDKISKDFTYDFSQWNTGLYLYPMDESGQDLVLCWQISYYPHMGDRVEYFIDAIDGSIIKYYSSICKFHDHGLSNIVDGPAVANSTDLLNQNRAINTYEVGTNFFMIDASRNMYNQSTSNLPNDPQGVIWTIDAFDSSPQNDDFAYDHIQSVNNNWSASPEGVSAQHNAGRTYEYFKNTHGRESVNGGGSNIISIVNVSDENGSSMGNAFWNGLAIFYGNGDSNFFPLGRALDVAGHEISHGVIQNTANLEYFGESGAMNESFADIFGAMIDRGDWKIGEDVVRSGAFPSGALRDMQDPHNGAATGNFGGGWQPKHVSEKFNGQEDNNGVHINSGIPNHAYYRFAISIGKDKAEKVFYRALTTYLTKSSKFVDLRNAVIKASGDLYGTTEEDAAKNAFNAVGIGAGAGNNNQQEIDENPGADFMLLTDEGRTKLILDEGGLYGTGTGDNIVDPLVNVAVGSKPSITDAGDEIVFVGEDKKIYIVNIDWSANNVTINFISEDPVWRNVVISKNGGRIAALTDDLNNRIIVFDFDLNAQTDFELYNPTFTEGIETGDVNYADAMEFNYTGEVLMYDAENSVSSSTAGTIEYWDIGFLEVWNNAEDTWALGNISKLFSALPEGTSVGNPTFAKNSPFIVAFDFIESDANSILGVNTETGDVGLIRENTGLGYPSFSPSDAQIVYDVPFLQDGELAGFDLGVSNMNVNKITANESSHNIRKEFVRWGGWFSDGVRVLSEVVDLGNGNVDLEIFPNPVTDIVSVKLSSDQGDLLVEIVDMMGNKLRSFTEKSNIITCDFSDLSAGTYIINLSNGETSICRKIVKL